MRVSESQLRRIVRKLVREAPLADIYPTQSTKFHTSLAAASGDYSYTQSAYEPAEIEQAKRIFGTKKYAEKLKKLVAGWDVNVYWAPQVPENVVYGPRGDADLYDPQEFLSKVGPAAPEASKTVRSWMSIGDPNSALFIVEGGPEGSLTYANTPWMALHALFNVTTGPRSPLPVFDDPSFGFENDILEIIEELLSAGNKFSDIEKIFTMGAARRNYFSGQGNLGDVEGDIAELADEIKVQCVLPKGFSYNKAALDAALAKSGDEELAERAYELFDGLVSESPAIMKRFLDKIRGKIVVVDVNALKLG